MKKTKPKIKVINIMADGRQLDSLAGIEAPEALYDIILKDYRAQGIELVPVTAAENVKQLVR